MFVETISAPAQEWQVWNDRLRLFTDPPAALVASIVWNAGDGQVSGVNLWASAEAVADFFVERVHPLVAVDGKPATTPARHGEPVAVYLRRQMPSPGSQSPQ
jgi:hypothetical protein